MAYRLSVHRLADRDFLGTPPEVDGADFDAWVNRCDELCLFDAPLGSGDSVATYWSRLASELSLSLLAGLYRDGLECAGPDLGALRQEVDSLVGHWIATIDPAETITYSVVAPRIASEISLEVPLLVDLLRRADEVRSAIRIAQRVRGYISIS